MTIWCQRLLSQFNEQLTQVEMFLVCDLYQCTGIHLLYSSSKSPWTLLHTNPLVYKAYSYTDTAVYQRLEYAWIVTNGYKGTVYCGSSCIMMDCDISVMSSRCRHLDMPLPPVDPKMGREEAICHSKWSHPQNRLNFKSLYCLNKWVIWKFSLHAVFMNREISYGDHSISFEYTCKHLNLCCKVGDRWGSTKTDSLLEPASSGHSGNLTFFAFLILAPLFICKYILYNTCCKPFRVAIPDFQSKYVPVVSA